MSQQSGGTFRSLQNRNYRWWIGGSLVSNIGSWMQGTAQAWLVLTELTDNAAGAVGVVTALQFAPQLFLVAFTGTLADHVDRRKLLIVIQSVTCLLALLLGLITVTGVVQLWHVYVFALALGCTMAFEAPARHSFVPELVGEHHLSNAVALNGMVFNLGRMIGPALSGIVIALVGTGWSFILNGISCLFVIAGLVAVRVVDLHRKAHEERGKARLLDGFRYVRQRPDIMTIFIMLFVIGALGMNFAVFIAAMSVKVFHANASEYGLLSSIMAIGSIAGALLAARRERPHMGFIIGGATLFGGAMLLGAIAPTYLLFGGALILLGFAAQTLLTAASSLVQLTTEPALRGRVMAIHVAIMLGGLPIGAPLIGWVADHFGPRWSLGLGAAGGGIAALIGLAYLSRARDLRLHWEEGRPAVRIRPDPHWPQ